jgi:hypothetical protein
LLRRSPKASPKFSTTPCEGPAIWGQVLLKYAEMRGQVHAREAHHTRKLALRLWFHDMLWKLFL